jgi:hypothetical protein
MSSVLDTPFILDGKNTFFTDYPLNVWQLFYFSPFLFFWREIMRCFFTVWF